LERVGGKVVGWVWCVGGATKRRAGKARTAHSPSAAPQQRARNSSNALLLLHAAALMAYVGHLHALKVWVWCKKALEVCSLQVRVCAGKHSTCKAQARGKGDARCRGCY